MCPLLTELRTFCISLNGDEMKSLSSRCCSASTSRPRINRMRCRLPNHATIRTFICVFISLYESGLVCSMPDASGESQNPNHNGHAECAASGRAYRNELCAWAH